MTNELTAAIRSHESMVGTWLSIGHPALAELSASLGYDFVVVDTEHAPVGTETVEQMLRGVDAAPGDTRALVRVAWNDPVRIKRVLDLGVDGLIVPMVQTAEEAETAVEAVRYPPEGIRGIAATRASEYGLNFEEYVESHNEEILTIVQIESESAVENVREIAAVDGIDAVFVGPADLSASLGVFGEWDGEVLAEAVAHVLDEAHAIDVPVGTLALSDDEIRRDLDRGFDFLVAGTDAGHLVAGNRRMQATYESALDDHE